MNEEPLVSVVMPFYNDRAYLPAALESYFSQTYANLEMVIVDDCSEFSPEALVSPAPKYPVRIIRSGSRLGPGGARNLGIRQARGELIAFLDSDDIWMPEFIRKCVNVFSADKNTAWVYTDGYYIIDDKPVHKPNSRYFGFKHGLPVGRMVNEYHLRGYVFELMSANAVRRSAIEEAGFFNENLKISEDWDFFRRLAEKCHVNAINEPLVYYRKRPDGFHYSKLEKYVEVHSGILTQMYEKQGLLPERMADLRRAIALAYERAGIQYLNKGNPERARYFFTHAAIAPIRFNARVMALKIFSFLPSGFYRLSVKMYDALI